MSENSYLGLMLSIGFKFFVKNTHALGNGIDFEGFHRLGDLNVGRHRGDGIKTSYSTHVDWRE